MLALPTTPSTAQHSAAADMPQQTSLIPSAPKRAAAEAPLCQSQQATKPNPFKSQRKGKGKGSEASEGASVYEDGTYWKKLGC